MFRTNGALIGTRRTADGYSAPGVWGLEEQCRWQRTSSWPVSKDPYLSNVSLLLHMENESGIYSFIDYSGNDLTVTSSGDAQISTAQSKFGSASAYFDGNGDWLSTPDNLVFQFGTGDFTIEGWFYASALTATYPAILGNGNASFSGTGSTGAIVLSVINNPRKLYFATNTTNPIVQSTTTVSTGQWYHFAITRSGTTVRMFLNGNLEGSATNSQSLNLSNNGLQIGRTGWDGTAGHWNGYIDELRITKGVARYTSSFPVPTSQFQGFRLYPIIRTNNYSLSPSQTSTVTFDFIEDPIGFGLGGVTAYGGVLSNLTAINSSRYTATFTPNSVISYDTASVTVNAGSYFDRFGQSNNQRSLSFSVNNNGVDPSYPNVSLLLHMNGNNGATIFTDNSGSPLTVTPSGRVMTSSAQSKFSGSSGDFDGVGSFLSVPTTSGVFNFGFGDFTIESWIYLRSISGNQVIATIWPGPSDSQASFRFRTSNDTLVFNAFTPQGQPTITSSSCLTANTWHHVAAVRNGTVYTLYCNGVSVGTLNSSSAINDAQGNLEIGRSGGTNTWFFNGYIDDFRITKGVARYTGNFTPSSVPFPDVSTVSVIFTSNKFGASIGGTSTITLYFSNAPVGFDLTDAVINGGVLSSLTPTVNPLVYTATFTVTSNTPNGTATISVNSNAFTNSGGIGNISSSFSFPVNSVDTNFSNVSLLLHMDGANNGTTFTDSSTNALTLIPNANAKTSVTQSKFGNTSGYFDGISDFLTVPATSGVFNFGSGNFTIEAWIFLMSTSGNQVIATIWPGPSDSQASFRFRTSNDTLVFDVFTSNTISTTSSSCLTSNTWHHVAAVRNGTVYTLYCNGVSVGTLNSAVTPRDAQGNLEIGRSGGTNTWFFRGYMDELRITKGVARYTGNFTPSTTAFPDVMPVSATITSDKLSVVTGDTATITFTLPSIPGTFGLSDITTSGGYLSNFTVTGNPYVYTATFNPTSVVTNDTATITVNVGSYINISSSFSLTVNFVDPYFSNVSLLLYMNGSNNSTTFTDSSNSARTVTPNGNTKISTAQSKFGGASAYFDGSGDYLQTPYSTSAFDWWTTDFTVEAWVYATSWSTWSNFNGSPIPVLVGNMSPPTDTNYWSFGPISDGRLKLYYFSGSAQHGMVSTDTLPTSQWVHIAAVKTTSGVKLFINGTPSSNLSISGTPQSSSGTSLIIGMYNNSSLQGYVDDLRITKGVARYSSSFTPPQF